VPALLLTPLLLLLYHRSHFHLCLSCSSASHTLPLMSVVFFCIAHTSTYVCRVLLHRTHFHLCLPGEANKRGAKGDFFAQTPDGTTFTATSFADLQVRVGIRACSYLCWGCINSFHPKP
jgi:hypothetical protein